jgi:ribosomal protein L7/L12
VRTLNEVESERDRSVASNRLSKYSQKISLIKEMRESTILTMPEIEKLIEDTEAALHSLTKN